MPTSNIASSITTGLSGWHGVNRSEVASVPRVAHRPTSGRPDVVHKETTTPTTKLQAMATYQNLKAGTLVSLHLIGDRGKPITFTINGTTITVPDREADRVNEAFVRSGWFKKTS